MDLRLALAHPTSGLLIVGELLVDLAWQTVSVWIAIQKLSVTSISTILSLRIAIGGAIRATSRSILHARSVTLTVLNASVQAKPAKVV